MLKRSLALAVVPVLTLPATALGAEPGPYRGPSTNKEIYLYGDIEPRTDKGKVNFTAKRKAVTDFKLSGQQFMCGAGPHAIPVSVAKMQLSSSGKGKGTYTNPDVGSFKVAIQVTNNGRASGTITPNGLCSGKVTFSAKLR